MANDAFDAPASGGNFNNKDHDGKLLLITPTEYVKEMTTKAGVTDAIRANIVVLDEKDPAKSDTYDDALLFGKVLNGQTRAKIGKGMVLGRLGHGDAQPGKNAPWMLFDPTEDDKVVGRAYLASQAPQL